MIITLDEHQIIDRYTQRELAGRSVRARNKIPDWSPFMPDSPLRRREVLVTMIELSEIAKFDKTWVGNLGARRTPKARAQRREWRDAVAAALTLGCLNTNQVATLTGYSHTHVQKVIDSDPFHEAYPGKQVRAKFNPFRLHYLPEIFDWIEQHQYVPGYLLEKALLVGDPNFLEHILGLPSDYFREAAKQLPIERGLCVNVVGDQ